MGSSAEGMWGRREDMEKLGSISGNRGLRPGPGTGRRAESQASCVGAGATGGTAGREQLEIPGGGGRPKTQGSGLGQAGAEFGVLGQ